MHAQMITVSEDISIRNEDYYILLGNLEERILVLKGKDQRMQIFAFDQRMRINWEKELEIDEKRSEVLDVIARDDDFLVFTKYKKRGKHYAKIRQYDPAANLIDSATVVDFGKSLINIPMRTMMSEDEEHAVFYYLNQQNELSATSIYVDSFEQNWVADFTITDLKRYRNYQEQVVDNNGNLYYIVEKHNDEDELEEHQFEVYFCEVGQEVVQKMVIDASNFITSDALFQYDNINKRLIGGGIYGENDPYDTKGTFMFSIDPVNPVDRFISLQPYEVETMSALLGKQVDENEHVPDMSVQDLVLRQDGGVLVIAERTRELERQMRRNARGYDGNIGSQYIVDHYYDDIYIQSIHADGQSHWQKILHKKQYSQDDNAAYSSYFLSKTPKQLKLLFNDDIKQNNTVSEYVINGSGLYDRNSLMSTENQDLRLRFREGLQVASNEVIIPSERRSRLKLVRVTY